MFWNFCLAALLASIHISTCSDLVAGCDSVAEVPQPELGRALLQIHRVLPQRAELPEAAARTDAQSVANATQDKALLSAARWTDLGAGCCSRSQTMSHGGLYAGNESSLDACKAKCLELENCGYVEYGWSRDADQWCIVWPASQTCSSLAQGERDCGGNGSTGVHTYALNRWRVLETYNDLVLGSVANTTVLTLQGSQDALTGRERSAGLAERHDVSRSAVQGPPVALAASTQADVHQTESKDETSSGKIRLLFLVSHMVCETLAIFAHPKQLVKTEEFLPPFVCFVGMIGGLAMCFLSGTRMRDGTSNVRR